MTKPYYVITPRGERLPTSQRTFTHMVVFPPDVAKAAAAVLLPPVYCTIFAGECEPCAHGWEYERESK